MKGGGGEGSASAHESALDLKDGRLKKKKRREKKSDVVALYSSRLARVELFFLADWRREDKSGKHNSHTTGFARQLHFSFF